MSEILKKEHIGGDVDEALRPCRLEDYFGQDKVKKNVSVFIKSAKIRCTHLDHLLFYGPPGTGKTTIANIIACEMGKNIKTTSGPAIDKPGDLASMLMNIQDGDILFIDEIHRLPKPVEEVLYSAMEDFAIDILVGDNNSSKAIRLPLPKFTLIGATTKAGSIAAPLRDRFGSINRLELYEPVVLADIIKRDAAILKIGITDEGAMEIALRARGTPRIAIRLLKRVLDFAVVDGSDTISKDIACEALDSLGIDRYGLDDNDRRLLKAISVSFNGGPVGIETLASFIGEDIVTIEDVCEPFLMQCGFISKTPRGRVITADGEKYIKKT